MPTIKDITRQRFGMLVAVSLTSERLDGAAVWICVCDCGATCQRSRRNLRNGATTSCGCKRRQFLCKGKPYHGKSGTATYRVWSGMLTRCFNSKDPDYARYGARGITVCERWLDFRNFVADIGMRPAPPVGTDLKRFWSIERIDNAGNYEPGNCKWATTIEQGNNRRTNVHVEIGGVTHTVAEWARLTGLRAHTAAQRIRAGWPPAVAVTKESRGY